MFQSFDLLIWFCTSTNRYIYMILFGWRFCTCLIVSNIFVILLLISAENCHNNEMVMKRVRIKFYNTKGMEKYYENQENLFHKKNKWKIFSARKISGKNNKIIAKESGW